jgi:lysophospholipase L1-like esterase
MTESNTKSSSTGRVWTQRAIAVLSPFLILAMLELSFRMIGAYEGDEWADPNVSFDEGALVFPAWDRQLAMPRPEGTMRLVTLGGSSTLGVGVKEPFALLLEQQMSAMLPDQRVEVINGGAHAIGSHRVFKVLKRAAEFDVDVALVYLGHNEFLEEIFFDPEGLVGRAERIGKFARRLRVVNWLKGLSGLTGETKKPRAQRHFFGNMHFPLIRSEAQYALRLQFLESTLKQMIAFAAAHEVQIIFIPAVPNLLSAPGDSIHGPAYEARSEAWDELFARAESQPDSELFAIFDQLHAIDSEFAMLHYMLGQARLTGGDVDRGLQALQKANLLDRRGDRANADVMDCILRVCAEHNVSAVDLREAFFAEIPAENQRQLRGESLELFLDHCHPTQKGHQMIADAFVNALVAEDR